MNQGLKFIVVQTSYFWGVYTQTSILWISRYILNKTQLPFLGFTQHITYDICSELFDKVNKKGLIDLLVISRFECICSSVWILLENEKVAELTFFRSTSPFFTWISIKIQGLDKASICLFLSAIRSLGNFFQYFWFKFW